MPHCLRFRAKSWLDLSLSGVGHHCLVCLHSSGYLKRANRTFHIWSVPFESSVDDVNLVGKGMSFTGGPSFFEASAARARAWQLFPFPLAI